MPNFGVSISAPETRQIPIFGENVKNYEQHGTEKFYFTSVTRNYLPFLPIRARICRVLFFFRNGHGNYVFFITML